MEKLRFGVIGCGYQTTKNMAPAMQKCPQASIVGFYDLDKSKSQTLSQAYSCKMYDHLEEMLNDVDVDAVYIATPISTHEELCLSATEYGKHILCEKPLGMNPEQARNITAACEHGNVRLMEGFMYQYHTQHQFVRDMIAKGEIGEPLVFYAWFGFPPFPPTDFRMIKELGGGATLDAGSYVIHAAKMFFGREPLAEHRVISYREDGLDMHGSILLDFGLGQSAQLTYGIDNSYKNSYSIWGTKGEITLLRAFSIPEYEIPICRVSNQSILREYQLKPCNHFVEEIGAFVKLVSSALKIK